MAMTSRRRFLTTGLTLPVVVAAEPKEAPKAELVSCERIWDRAPHCAFTDLIQHNGQWLCCFREGLKHVSPDGHIRILHSDDGTVWRPWSVIEHPVADLRDPKFTRNAGGALMLTAAGAMHPPSDARHKTFAWFSSDGREWTAATQIGDSDFWLWRVHWFQGKAYAMGYATAGESVLRAYMSTDGRRFTPLGDMVANDGRPNETAMLFDRTGSALCIVRREEGTKTAHLGFSRPPYRGWEWKDLGVRVGGPNLLRLSDGRIVFAGRLYDGSQRTALGWLNPDEPSLTEFISLPSNGDSSYPGLVFHDDLLWVSYYSSHESRTSIYLAKVKLPPYSR
ncbi:MAG TPA: hypothetical protein VFB63_16220 [Bryobacteraceae bacterium]|nr:hypothetical protein [Bryobacteraceae bacterium]